MLRSASIGFALVLASCAAPPGPMAWADVAARADEAARWSASVTALLVVPGNLDPAATPELTAAAAADVATDPFDPNECVTRASVDGATVTYQLDDCSGSFGLVHVTGALVVTYLPTTTGRTEFHASATDLLLNGEPVTFDARAAVLHDVAMGQRTIELTVDAHGAGHLGSALTRHGTETARWSDTWGCLFVDTAQSALTLDGVSWEAQTTALNYCVGECPESGGAVRWTGASGSVQLGYGGSQSVDWSVAGEPPQAGMLTISCGF